MLTDIAKYLHAMGEPEYAAEVENAHHRLEAFSIGLDVKTREAMCAAIKEETIEQCAEVCEEYQGSADLCAAAIRAMKS